jgi:hypothetical protein|tara:strand:+ start:203 stop:382 length:180 start_codon:yes stop_codon:yes gene_type:complete
MQFIKKTRSRVSILGLSIKISLTLLIVIGMIFVLNKINFPAPKKEIDKIISNENFKIVK